MRKSSRILLVAAPIVVAGLLALPYGFGVMAKHSFYQAINQIPAQPGVTIEVTKFQNHWFTSFALVKAKINPGQMNGQTVPDVGFVVKAKIWHGPFIFSKDINDHMRFFFARAFARGQVKVFGVDDDRLPYSVQAPNRITMLTGLMGDITTQLSMPTFTIKSKTKPAQLTMTGLTATYTLNSDFDRQKASFAVQQLTTQIGDIVISGKGIHHTFDISKALSHLWTGTSEVTVDSISGSSNQKEILVQKNTDVKSSVGIENELLSMTVNMSIGNLKMYDKAYGPGVIAFTVKNIGAQAMNQLHGLQQQLGQQKVTFEEYLHAFDALAPDLLGHGLQVQVAPCELQTPYGKATASVNASFPVLAQGQSTKLLDMIKRVTTSNQFSLPKTLVTKAVQHYFTQKYTYMAHYAGQQVQQQLTPANMALLVNSKVQAMLTNWQQAGYLTSQGDNYVAAFSYKDGQAQVNGKTL